LVRALQIQIKNVLLLVRAANSFRFQAPQCQLVWEELSPDAHVWIHF
jgi:hypothetical protein